MVILPMLCEFPDVYWRFAAWSYQLGEEKNYMTRKSQHPSGFPGGNQPSSGAGGWPTPLENMSSSFGIMKFPTYGKS